MNIGNVEANLVTDRGCSSHEREMQLDGIGEDTV